MIYRYTVAHTQLLYSRKPPNPRCDSSWNEADTDEAWDEGLGIEGTKRALLYGVRRQRLTRLQHQLTSHLKVRDIDGQMEILSHKRGRVDRQRYLAGNSRCMWHEIPGKERAHSLRIGVNISANCHVSAQVWEQRGAAVLALVNAAERLNIRVSLDAVIRIWNMFDWQSSEEHRMIVHLKKENERLAAGTANFFLAHSAAFRRAGFRLMEHVAEREGKTIAPGYGRSEESLQEEMPLNANGTPMYDLWVPSWIFLKSPEDLIDTAVNWTATFNKTMETEQ